MKIHGILDSYEKNQETNAIPAQNGLGLFMPKVVVSAIGKDQPGIVSSVTGILYRHGASIEDSSMTILEENFAMIMIVSLPREATAAEFAEDFRKLEKKFQYYFTLN